LIDETDLSTKPAEAQASPWLSCAQGDHRRTKSAGVTPREGPQAALRLVLAEKQKTNQQVSAHRAGISMGVIKKRRDFLAMRDAEKSHAASFLMLSRSNLDNGPAARLGLTVTKKLGGAVIRNRIRRRLRAAAREIFPQNAASGTDYVLVARRAAYDRKYDALLDDMKRALLRLTGNPT
jgi:ribonuclease P protein component